MAEWQKTVYRFLAPSGHPNDRHQDMNTALIWRGFKETTSVHGIPHIDRAPGVVKKVFWCLLSMVTFCALLYNITNITRSFFSFKVNVRVELLHANEMKFPAVTVCNMSPVRKSAIARITQQKETITEPAKTKKKKRKRKKRATVETSVTCESTLWSPYLTNCYTGLPPEQVYTYDKMVSMGRVSDFGKPVVITTAEQQAFIATVTVSNGFYWIGLKRDATDPTKFVWEETGQTASYTNWDGAAGEPKSPGDCVVMSTEGLWYTKDCGAKSGFVSYKPGTPMSTVERPTEEPSTTEATTTQTTTVAPTTTTETTTTVAPTTTTETTTTAVPTTTTVTTTTSTVTPTTTTPTTAATTTTTELQTSTADAQTTSVSSTTTTTTQTTTTTTQTTTPQATLDEPASTDTEAGVTKQTTTGETAQTTTTAMPPTASTDSGAGRQTCCRCCSADGSEHYGVDTPTWWGQTTKTNTSATVNETTSAPVVSQTIAGSRFPERTQQREAFQEQEAFTETLADMSMDDKINIGYQQDEFILDCQFSGYDCSTPKDFQLFYNPTHGNCYIFNSGWNASRSTQWKSYKAGRRFGLELILNINQEDYTPLTGDTAGIRLVVHPQERMPFPEDEGITVSPGHSTSIGMRQMVISRLGPPFGECKNIKQPHVDLNVFEELYPVNYSSNACFKTCYQRHVIERCDCGDAYYPMKGLAFGDASVVACRTTNITQDDCRYEVRRMFANNELDCDCTPPCLDSEFDLLISTGQWPSDVQQAAILTRLKPKIESLLSDPTDKYKYKRNLIKLEIYFEEFNIERISELEAYAVANYLSDIGGVLGLWLGCSILTVAEFLELFMDIAVLSVIKRCGRNRISKVSIKQDPGAGPNSSDGGRDDFGLQAMPKGDYPTARSRRGSSFRSPPPRYKSRDDLAVEVDGKNTVLSLMKV